jgi:hypothetical protein
VSDTIVYGYGTYLPESVAYEMALTWHAFTAKTWGEFRDLHPQLYADAIDRWDAPPFTTTIEGLLAARRAEWQAEREKDDEFEEEPTEADVRDAYQELLDEYEDEYGDRIPPGDDEAFDPERVPGFEHGYWHGPYVNDRLEWVPEEMWEQFERDGGSTGYDWEGYTLEGDEDAIVAALRGHGFVVREDRDLIAAATQGILAERAYTAVLERARQFHHR